MKWGGGKGGRERRGWEEEIFNACFLGRQTIVKHIWDMLSRRQERKKEEIAIAFIGAVRSPAECGNKEFF